ncbi:MAG: hypothetical protein BWY92_00265 [Firmicutes bacterium ADurb.BinA052]|nr:MAG: hypothetical protein BWY92_00265 [Firmicutes bacterium ADurb.BinA052]
MPSVVDEPISREAFHGEIRLVKPYGASPVLLRGVSGAISRHCGKRHDSVEHAWIYECVTYSRCLIRACQSSPEGDGALDSFAPFDQGTFGDDIDVIEETRVVIPHMLAYEISHVPGFFFKCGSVCLAAELSCDLCKVHLLCIQVGVEIDRFLRQGVPHECALRISVFEHIDAIVAVKPGRIVHPAFPCRRFYDGVPIDVVGMDSRAVLRHAVAVVITNGIPPAVISQEARVHLRQKRRVHALPIHFPYSPSGEWRL